MEERIFHHMECLSESRSIKAIDIYEKLFDKNKRCDKRHLESAVQRFILLNKRVFSFLGIETELSGTGSDLSLKFRSSNFIGSVPVRMPYDGIAHKDFQVTPRFDSSNNIYSNLTQLLSKLNYSISPEFIDSEKLTQPLLLRPPMYYEAAKYIDIFERSCKVNWVKFEVVQAEHRFPKSSTNWSKYAQASSDPRKALRYISSDSILSKNHREWQELKYVFEKACSIILQPHVPGSIRYKFLDQMDSLKRKTASITPQQTNYIAIRASDPFYIKEVKQQANILLQNSFTFSVAAWRMDMAQLFERYVQYITTMAAKGRNASVKVNSRIRGRGNMPQWGLRYLEPDLLIKMNDKIIMADAKYKAHNYAFHTKSDVLKESHRSDLHQILAYCSFSPEKDKTGILFYPSNDTRIRKIQYTEQLCGISNKILLCGLPFGIDGIDSSIKFVRDILTEEDSVQLV